MKNSLRYQLKEKGKVKPKPALTKDLEQWLMELPTGAAVIIAFIGTIGIASILLLAPNMLQLLGKFIQHNTGRKPSQKEVENRLVQTVYYLKKTGTINISQDNKGIWLSLTRKGIAKQHKFSITTVVIPRPTKWDKSYWLVAADIPTKTHGHMADAFRRKLAQLHFYPLQRTLWLYPYNPKGQLQSLVHYFTIAPFVTLMHISELDRSDKDLAERFWKEHNIL